MVEHQEVTRNVPSDGGVPTCDTQSLARLSPRRALPSVCIEIKAGQREDVAWFNCTLHYKIYIDVYVFEHGKPENTSGIVS